MPASAVAITFDAGDIFRLANDPGDGLFQHEQENGHQLWYRDENGTIVNWGVTYGQSQVARYESPTPNAAYNNLASLISDPAGIRTTAFNISLRAYDGTTEGWGQNVVFRNPPSDWDAGDDALAATLFSATAPAGWKANYRWVPFIGPVVQWVTDDPYDASTTYVDPTTRDLFFSFSADLMLDTDMDGIGDTEPGSGDEVRLYVGTAFVFANWAATGIDFPKVTQGPQYDSVVRASASVPSTPATALLLAIACGTLGLVKKTLGKKGWNAGSGP